MRFHKFQSDRGGSIVVNLDSVAALSPLGMASTRIWGPGMVHEVSGSVDEVLRLISPPAAPDTFEEDLAKAAIIDVEELRSRAMRRRDEAFGAAAARLKDGLEDRPMTAEEEFPNGAWLNRPMVDAEVRAARLDELNRTVFELIGKSPNFHPLWVKDYVAKRRAEIREGKG